MALRDVIQSLCLEAENKVHVICFVSWLTVVSWLNRRYRSASWTEMESVLFQNSITYSMALSNSLRYPWSAWDVLNTEWYGKTNSPTCGVEFSEIQWLSHHQHWKMYWFQKGYCYSPICPWEMKFCNAQIIFLFYIYEK